MNRKARRMLKSIGLGGKESSDPKVIAQQYMQACAEAGELQYKIIELQEGLDTLNDRIRKLNRSYAEILAESKAAAPEGKVDEQKS
jgi:hypothetical protein